MKKMLKKTNLSAQNDCLHTYVTKKSNLQSQGRKITGTKHDPKYGHFPIPKEGNRITYILPSMYSAEYRSRVGTL